MEFPIVILIVVLILFEIFWFIQLLELMARDDKSFPGRYDKPVWAAILLLGNVIGALAYLISKSHKNLTQSVHIKESLKQSPEPCLKCGKIIPEDTTKCPFCGWSYREDK